MMGGGGERDLRVLIADAQPLFRYGLRRALEEAGGFEIVSEVSDGPEALREALERSPDLAFLDSALPPRRGRDVLEAISKRIDGARPILVLPGAIETPILVDMIRLGARGIIERCAPVALAVKAARCVADGEYWIGREAVGDLARSLAARESGPDDPSRPAHPAQRLTAREREIAREVAAGRCNKEIAARLSLSEDTVKHHLSSTFAKLGVANRLELAVLMLQNGFVEKAPVSSP